MIAYVLPTRNRPERLAQTLRRLGALPRHDAEVIVVDNASDPPSRAALVLDNGLPVRVLMRSRNEGASGRNAGVLAADPSATWIVMLDDDSAPLDLGYLEALRDAPADVAAIGAEIVLPPGPEGSTRRESGGLPEVFVGCGVAIRRSAWEASADARLDLLAGYDPSFGFYAEEYDLSARFIRAGGRIVHDRRFRVLHEKTSQGRDMHLILGRLVRNNGWVMARYAPEDDRLREIWRTIVRYGRIAHLERAERGYLTGLGGLVWTLGSQRRAPLNAEQWDRFIGLSACREALGGPRGVRRGERVAVVHPGKNAHVVHGVLMELGARVVSATDPEAPETLVVGTLSPGPMLDAIERATREGGRSGHSRILAPMGSAWAWPVDERADSMRAAA